MPLLLPNRLKPTSLQPSLLVRSFNSWSLAIQNAPTPHKALQIFSQMHRQATPLDGSSIVSILKSSSHLHNLALTTHLHAHILKLGMLDVHTGTSLLQGYAVTSFGHACQLFDEMPKRNVVTWNTMIAGYSKSGDLKRARLVFEEMPKREIGSWTGMIQAYMVNGHWKLGLALFQEMMANDKLKPDQMTMGSVLAACSRMDAPGLPLGKSVHGLVVKKGWELDENLGRVLMDMYAKCGSVKDVYQVFKVKPPRQVKSWTTLICGFANHGFGKEALAMFHKMQQMGVKPNEMTFVGILCACVHAGLVEEDLECFKMIGEYGLEPIIEHYECMVDLCGRAGMLEEAYEMIMTMKYEPNVVLWSSFLSACKEYKRFDMFERVVEHVMDTIKLETNGRVFSLICDLHSLTRSGMMQKEQGK